MVSVMLDPLNAELNPIRHLLALVEARHIVHVSRIRVNSFCPPENCPHIRSRRHRKESNYCPRRGSSDSHRQWTVKVMSEISHFVKFYPLIEEISVESLSLSPFPRDSDIIN